MTDDYVGPTDEELKEGRQAAWSRSNYTSIRPMFEVIDVSDAQWYGLARWKPETGWCNDMGLQFPPDPGPDLVRVNRLVQEAAGEICGRCGHTRYVHLAGDGCNFGVHYEAERCDCVGFMAENES